MRLVTYTRGDGDRLGYIADDGNVVDISDAAASVALRAPFDPTDMVSLIAAGRSATVFLEDIKSRYRGTTLSMSDIRLRAPIARPRKNILCVGLNYLKHFEESEIGAKSGKPLPAHPSFFTKSTTTVNGPYDPIPFDASASVKIDWEAELGVIIGKRGYNLTEADAMKHVFGYTVINDVTARDIQRLHGGSFKGKSFDGTCPMGPCIVTADEIDPDNLDIFTRVSGVTKQSSNTSDLYFKIPRLLQEFSLGMTLEPGDVIATGTPEGVGYTRKPPEFLKPGDMLETEIQQIGVLRNLIVRRE